MRSRAGKQVGYGRVGLVFMSVIKVLKIANWNFTHLLNELKTHPYELSYILTGLLNLIKLINKIKISDAPKE